MTKGIKETKLGSGITVTRRTTYDYGTKDGRAAVHLTGEMVNSKLPKRLSVLRLGRKASFTSMD